MERIVTRQVEKYHNLVLKNLELKSHGMLIFAIRALSREKLRDKQLVYQEFAENFNNEETMYISFIVFVSGIFQQSSFNLSIQIT